MLAKIKILSQEDRQNAYSEAQDAVIREVGDKPEREQFEQYAVLKYPPQVTNLITILCLVLLLAAFTPSAIRLYVIGSKTFGVAVPDRTAVLAVGIATILTAEIGQVVFSLALATLGTTRSSRRLLFGSMGIATAIALVGNIQVALPGHLNNPFAWLEAIAPPILVLSTAFVLKEQLLESIEMRHANERAFQNAMNVWIQATLKPETHPNWIHFHANALRDALRKKNSRRKDVLAELSTDDWRSLVLHELQADHWYEQASVQFVHQEMKEDAKQEEVPLALSTNGNK